MYKFLSLCGYLVPLLTRFGKDVGWTIPSFEPKEAEADDGGD